MGLLSFEYTTSTQTRFFDTMSNITRPQKFKLLVMYIVLTSFNNIYIYIWMKIEREMEREDWVLIFGNLAEKWKQLHSGVTT